VAIGRGAQAVQVAGIAEFGVVYAGKIDQPQPEIHAAVLVSDIRQRNGRFDGETRRRFTAEQIRRRWRVDGHHVDHRAIVGPGRSAVERDIALFVLRWRVDHGIIDALTVGVIASRTQVDLADANDPAAKRLDIVIAAARQYAQIEITGGVSE